MQKKLLAAAVGTALGALAAPAAMAQNATVNVYGQLYGEFATVNNGAKSATELYQKYEHWQNPNSYLGFRGEEKLGGGMSAWFQCEITMDYRGTGNSAITNAQSGGTLCTRNSAIGLKGAYTNTFYGNWDTPFKRAAGDSSAIGANGTGVFGVSHILFGTASTNGISPPAGNVNIPTISASTGALTNTTLQNNLGPGAWSRRQNNLLTVESNNIAGFQLMGATTLGNYATGATLGVLRPRVYSVGATYQNYGLRLGAAYERHKNFYAATSPACPTGVLGGTFAAPTVTTTTSCHGSDENAYSLAASYTWRTLKVGGLYTKQNADVSAVTGATANVSAWTLGADWMFYGPHGVRMNYARANDTKGTPGAAVATRPVVACAVPATCGSNGAAMWQIRYVYAFSKRTEGTLGYSKTNNKQFGTYETGGASTTQLGGQNSHAFAMALRHAF